MRHRFPDSPRRPDRAAVVIGLLLAGVGGLLLWEAHRLPQQGGYGGVGPADVPRMIGWGLMALAVWTVVEAIRGGFEPRPRQQVPAVLWIVGGLAAQLLLLPVAGFSIASGVLFACTARGFGERRLWIALPAGLIFALLVYGLFDGILSLNLPSGPPERLIYGG
ncbi:tripartite tricarboxylate transporter TctB family protein [Rhodobacter sphaeroides]|uniref:tripartite tricarboxylate transporter TctB family protein n=1 Tax=Cereibacter sphaeroides TaxID=1063 RepID=UPI0013279FCD|nr:tripartite tricarboxylate transporter TctB family protein [Cereibacter sphaeroides]MWP39430.1 tripartite tricarboxylate transporter TctB family protein [Cereibacter sphaeroides]